MRFLFFTLLISSCTDGLKIETTGVLTPYSVAEHQFQIIKPGGVLKILGKGFTNDQWVNIGGEKLKALWVSQTELKVDIPTDLKLVSTLGAKSGPVLATLSRNNKTVAIPNLFIAEDPNHSFYSGDPSFICEGKSFYNVEGKLSQGTNPCGKNLPSCQNPFEVDCVTSNEFISSLKADIKAENIKFGASIAGVAGSAGAQSVTPTEENPSCTVNGQIGCLTTSEFKAANLSNLVAANIKTGINIAGVNGTLTPSPANCSSAGQQSCVATGTYFAGTSCTPNSSGCYLPNYALSTQPLKAISFDAINSALASIKSSASLAGMSGTLADCNANGAIDCVTTSTYQSADLSNLTNTNIRSGVTIAGVNGNLAPSPANCSSAGQQSCVATGSFYAGTSCAANASACYVPTYSSPTQPLKAISFDSILGDKILAGQSIAGVNGRLALPGENKVLSGYGYGIDGTSMTGLLTLPAASDVLSPSAAYGDPSAPMTPAASTTLIVRPHNVSLTSVTTANGPDRITLNWAASAGATGYIVIIQSTPITFTPTDYQTYTTGTQGAASLIYVGTNTNFTYNTSLSSMETYYLAVYAYQGQRLYSASPAIRTVYSCPALSGGTWLRVPGDSVYGTTDFCVQKYIPSNVGGLPTSSATGTPWWFINQNTAKSVCEGLGSGYHLITNPEWMTLATNLAAVDSNWSGGVVGNGMLRKGHSDDDPNGPCAANASDAHAYVQTDCTGLNSGSFDQRRTATLSTGGVIWDIGGNLWQWVDRYNNTDKPSTSNGWGWGEFTETTPSTNWPWSSLTPRNATHSFWSDSWNSAQGIGFINLGDAGSGGALLRGGRWDDGNSVGPFNVNLAPAPSETWALSFRCAWQP